MNSNWKLKPLPSQETIDVLNKSLGVPTIISELLVQRGVTNFQQAKDFFRPQLEHLHDPFLMKDMQKAVSRIEQAIVHKQKILVYGDYDVDGTTSVAMMYIFLSQYTDQVSYYIPDRYKEGYGVSFKGIDYAAENHFSLIICLDCGIKAIEKIDYSNKKGIDFIVCDHHRPGPLLPKAIAVLNPKRKDCLYPYKELSGCGVGFKLIQAYCLNNDISFDKIVSLLDLLAVSIAADIVPITGENRVLTFYGLKQINENARPGLLALIESSQRDKKLLLVNDLVFGIAPRINAAGRIDHAKKAVELLIEKQLLVARDLAKKVEINNSTRKELDSTITEEALKLVPKDKKSTVVFHPEWHKGVIGIVASRLIENHYRPTIVLTESNGLLVGSARSVIGFDVYNAIENCANLLEQFGGHKYAAGLSLKKENLQSFIVQFEKEVCQSITNEQMNPEILIDRELNFDQINFKTYRIINQMEPFGPGNSRPIFMTKNILDTGYAKLIGKDQTHLKLSITNSDRRSNIDAIGFGMHSKKDLVINRQHFSICYNIDLNEWNGKTSIQLRLKDLK